MDLKRAKSGWAGAGLPRPAWVLDDRLPVRDVLLSVEYRGCSPWLLLLLPLLDDINEAVDFIGDNMLEKRQREKPADWGGVGGRAG